MENIKIKQALKYHTPDKFEFYHFRMSVPFKDFTI